MRAIVVLSVLLVAPSNQHAGNEQKVHERMQAKWNRKVKLRLRQGESQTKFGVYDFGGRKLADLGD